MNRVPVNHMNFRKHACALLFLVPLAMAIASHAQTFTTLASFDGANGKAPDPLVQGTDGNFYGTTIIGASGNGTVFNVSAAGALTTIYTFCSQSGCGDGSNLEVALVQATNGNFYGTTYAGGANNSGSIFKVTPAGVLTTLYSFCALPSCIDGNSPSAGLVQAVNGNFYGTTTNGGAYNSGTVFEITPAGTLTTLHSFCALPNCVDGQYPLAPLIQAANGNLYGTTPSGGSVHNAGEIFQVTPTGKFTKLYTFRNGESPVTGLVQAANGNLYGTTTGGGLFSRGEIFGITTAGALTLLYSFCDPETCIDGMYPSALIQATNGNLYGTTLGYNPNNTGTIFEVTPKGKLTVLYTLCSQTNCADGITPSGALIQSTDGNLYGTTNGGGASGDGTVFRLSIGLGPFVETRPTIAKPGTKVTILGTDLTGATSVTFDGIAAAFTVVSPSEITTTVPTGATTGKVQVVTPGGTLKSNVAFQVI